jgi:SAM-dependent methyltransferase
MSDVATRREDFERLHAHLRDAELDAIAAIAGCAPAIGRLNYLDDATLERLVSRLDLPDGARVLDIGCGRGFFGRWLLSRGCRVTYTGVDIASSAVNAAARHLALGSVVRGDAYAAAADGAYHAVVLIESIWSVDEALARRLRALLAPAGMLAIVLTSIDEGHGRRLTETSTSLESAGFAVEAADVSADCAQTAGRLCAAALIEGFEDAWVRERMTGEARAVLAALREKTFRSSLVFASARS